MDYKDLTREQLEKDLGDAFYGKGNKQRRISIYPVNPIAFAKELNEALQKEGKEFLAKVSSNNSDTKLASINNMSIEEFMKKYWKVYK